MQNNNRLKNIVLAAALLLAAGFNTGVAADLSTLFTTPQERVVIDSNRYKNDSGEPEPLPVAVEQAVEQTIRPRQQEEVTQEYMISGITISMGGVNTVWINSQNYEDGEQLDDSSKIKILTGDEVRVRITAPDGKNHYATSGQTLEVTYLAPVGN